MNTLTALTQYGLTERQSQVYMTCLEFGTASIQKISKRLHIARSSCEATLNQLIERGFVSSHKVKNVRKYSPVDPRTIIKIAEQKVKSLSEQVPNLTNLFLKNNIIQSVRMYEGKNGINSILEEILAEAHTLYGFGSADDLFNAIGETFPQFRKRRIQKKIPVKIILKNTEQARQRQKAGPAELREVRLIDNVGDFSSLMFMWNSKIASFSLRDEIVAVVIESPEIASGQYAMFNSIWNSLAEYKR